MPSAHFWLRLGLFVFLMVVVGLIRVAAKLLGLPPDIVAFMGGWMTAEVLWFSFPSTRAA